MSSKHPTKQLAHVVAVVKALKNHGTVLISHIQLGRLHGKIVNLAIKQVPATIVVVSATGVTTVLIHQGLPQTNPSHQDRLYNQILVSKTLLNSGRHQGMRQKIKIFQLSRLIGQTRKPTGDVSTLVRLNPTHRRPTLIYHHQHIKSSPRRKLVRRLVPSDWLFLKSRNEGLLTLQASSSVQPSTPRHKNRNVKASYTVPKKKSKASAETEVPRNRSPYRPRAFSQEPVALTILPCLGRPWAAN
jgi:hypothetical protein